MVDGVIEAPGGAHFTECPPDYGRDEAFQREYAATAKDPDAWETFKARYLDVESEADYKAAVLETGENRSVSVLDNGVAVHPHTRGKDRHIVSIRLAAIGSPPHAWGRLHHYPEPVEGR